MLMLAIAAFVMLATTTHTLAWILLRYYRQVKNILKLRIFFNMKSSQKLSKLASCQEFATVILHMMSSALIIGLNAKLLKVLGIFKIEKCFKERGFFIEDFFRSS
jgi:hypothetical protein